MGWLYCTGLFLWFDDSQCFEEKENDFFVMTTSGIDTKFSRKYFKEFCYSHRFLFPNVSFVYRKEMKKNIYVCNSLLLDAGLVSL